MSVDALSQLRTADFLQVAQNADNRTVRLSSSGTVDNTRLPTFVSTNQKTLDGFVAALRRDFGTAIADAAHEQLKSLTNEGSLPLKGFMVRETVDKAIAAMQANINARDRFFSGIDPAHSFKSVMDKELDEHGIKDPKVRAAVAARAESEIRSQMSVTGSERVDSHQMEQLFRYSKTVGLLDRIEDRMFIERNLPGSFEDKLDILLMLGDTHASTRVIEALPLCRQIQPDGPLTRETIWLALTKEKPTPQQAAADENFGARLEEATTEMWAASLFGGDKEQASAVFGASGLHFMAAVDIAKTHRPITLADFIRPETRLSRCVKNVKQDLSEKSTVHNKTENNVAQDLVRLGNRKLTKEGKTEQASSYILMHLSDKETYRVKCGKEACKGTPEEGAFQFSGTKEMQEEKLRDYLQGRATEYTATLAEKCRQLCGGNSTQSTALFALFTQATPKVFAATGGMSGTGRLVRKLDEHMPMHYDMWMEGRVAKCTLTLDTDPEVSGSGTITISVSDNGEYHIDDVRVTFPPDMQTGA